MPEKLPMKHGFILSWAMWILRLCSCDVDTSLHLGMEMKFEVFVAVRMDAYYVFWVYMTCNMKGGCQLQKNIPFTT